MDNIFAPNPDLSSQVATSTSFAPSENPSGLPSPHDSNSTALLEGNLDGFSSSIVETEFQPAGNSILKENLSLKKEASQSHVGGKQQDDLTGDAPAVAEKAAPLPTVSSPKKDSLSKDVKDSKVGDSLIDAAPNARLSSKNLLKDALTIKDVRGIKGINDLIINPNFFSQFSIVDASRDSTQKTVFNNGALRLNYQWFNPSSLKNVRIEAVKGGSVVANLGTWSSSSANNRLINLSGISGINDGVYKIRATAETKAGSVFTSGATKMRVLPWSVKYGTIGPDTLEYSGAKKTGSVFLGRGGTDTLHLTNLSQSDVKNINGLSLGSFNPWFNSTTNQAIFQGSAFDYLTLKGGREIYFQGVENLKFSDGSQIELQVRPNDTHFGEQWNLRVSDVESAWRFTRGNNQILLASLDTGILTAAGASGGIHDISLNRLITDPTDDDNFMNYGHGHAAISVMASNGHNGSGVAGINWGSKVFVNDVYHGVNLQTAITKTLDYAKANNMKVVFQGGIQGESWLNNGGTQAQLEALISNNSDIALFAIAAGNGGPGGNLNDPNYLTSVSGVAKLQTNHNNVMSVGALTRTSTAIVNGLTNASAVDIASYSNRGSNLTLMAATNSPAMNKYGNMQSFGGTSAANPNMAGIASLVWSVNPHFNAGQIRQLLIDTAMDLGTPGKDNTFGHGLVNADAAVRRAWALKEDYQLASLYSSKRWQPGLFNIIDAIKVINKDIKFKIDPRFLTPEVEETPLNLSSKASLPIETSSLLNETLSLNQDGLPLAVDMDLNRGSSATDGDEMEAMGVGTSPVFANPFSLMLVESPIAALNRAWEMDSVEGQGELQKVHHTLQQGDRPSIFDALVAPNSTFLEDMVEENNWIEDGAEELMFV